MTTARRSRVGATVRSAMLRRRSRTAIQCIVNESTDGRRGEVKALSDTLAAVYRG